MLFVYFLFTSGSLSSIFLFPFSLLSSFFSLCALPMVVGCGLMCFDDFVGLSSWVWVCGSGFMGLGPWVCVRRSSTWPGLRLGWWVLVRVENEVGGWWLRWVVVAEAWVSGLFLFLFFWLMVLWGVGLGGDGWQWLAVGLGFDEFCLPWPLWVLGLWVLFAALSSASFSSSHSEALSSLV